MTPLEKASLIQRIRDQLVTEARRAYGDESYEYREGLRDGAALAINIINKEEVTTQ